MATRAERQEVLEQIDEDDFKELSSEWRGTWLKRPRDARIKWLLDDTERQGLGDRFDRALGLQTNGEQWWQLQRDGMATAKSSARAAWFSAGCALLAIIVSIIALVVALGESG